MHDKIEKHLKSIKKELAPFLERILSDFSEDWWDNLVIRSLTREQRYEIKKYNIKSLSNLDLHALLRVFSENWTIVSGKFMFSRQEMHYLNEMKTIRNKWEHINSEIFPLDDIYRDLDTMFRFAELIKASSELIEEIDELKKEVLIKKIHSLSSQSIETTIPSLRSPKFTVGQIIFLESDPSYEGEIVDVKLEEPESQYSIRKDGIITTHLASELRPKFDERSARILLEILRNIALADGMFTDEEVSYLELVCRQFGIPADLVGEMIPLEMTLTFYKSKKIGSDLYRLAANMAAADGTLDVYEQNMLDIIRDHFKISKKEADDLASFEFPLQAIQDEYSKSDAKSESEELGILKRIVSAFSETGKRGIEGLKKITSEIIDKCRSIFNNAASETWNHSAETFESVIERFYHMEKSRKILAISAMASGAVVSIPFIIGIGSLSIVGTLGALALGTLVGSGYGILRGVFANKNGMTVSTLLIDAIKKKSIDDENLENFTKNYKNLEDIIEANFKVIENNKIQFENQYLQYGNLAIFTAKLLDQITNDEKYNTEEVKEQAQITKQLIENIKSELKKIADSDHKTK